MQAVFRLLAATTAAAALLASTLTVQSASADTITSSASSLASKSVGSLSDSVSRSSNSSSGGGKVEAGAYQVTGVARLGDNRLQLQLSPSSGQAEGFALALPEAVVAEQGLRPGATLWVAERGYGLAFAAAAGQPPFFLAVEDRLRRDFESVKL